MSDKPALPAPDTDVRRLEDYDHDRILRFDSQKELARYLFDRAATHDMGFWDRLKLAAYCAAWVDGDGVEQYITDGSETDS